MSERFAAPAAKTLQPATAVGGLSGMLKFQKGNCFFKLVQHGAGSRLFVVTLCLAH